MDAVPLFWLFVTTCLVGWWFSRCRKREAMLDMLTHVPAYVISMPGRPRQAIARQLEAAGVYPQFVDAVVGSDVKDRSRFSKSFPWQDPQVGCALSHMLLWNRLKGPALIMEDDAIPSLNFSSVVHSIVKALHGATDAIDIVFLGHCFEAEDGEPWAGHPQLRRSKTPRCTHAYYVTPGGMDKLARWSSTALLDKPIDEALGRLCSDTQLRCLSVVPQIARQPWQNALHPPGVDPGPPSGTPS